MNEKINNKLFFLLYSFSLLAKNEIGDYDMCKYFKIFLLRYLYIDDLNIVGNITFELKNKKLIKFEVRNKNNELQFLATYNNYGVNGEMYINRTFGFRNNFPMKIMYKNGKAYGDVLEYYKNGKLYRKSHLKNNNTFLPFSALIIMKTILNIMKYTILIQVKFFIKKIYLMEMG